LFGTEKARSGEVPFPMAAAFRAVPPTRPGGVSAWCRRTAAATADAGQKHPLQHQPGRFRRQKGALGWYSQRLRAASGAEKQIAALRIKTRSATALANELSGGNQQKIVIGKWLEIAPKVFLLDDPTRGVDVGAKREIYGLIREMSGNGGIVMFSSTELPS
jgi:ribose transport system ATP-binding protein